MDKDLKKRLIEFIKIRYYQVLPDLHKDVKQLEAKWIKVVENSGSKSELFNLRELIAITEAYEREKDPEKAKKYEVLKDDLWQFILRNKE